MGKACSIQLKNDKNLNLPVEKVKLFNSYKLSKYHKFTDFLIGQIFREYSDVLGWTLRDLNKKENLNKITKALELRFQNILIENANEVEGSLYLKISDEVFTDINDVIIPNFASFIEDYYDNNSVINITDYDVNSALEQDEETFESETEEDVPEGEEVEVKGKEFDKSPQEQSMIQLADNEVKTLFKFIPKMLWNEKEKSTQLFFDTDGLPTTTESGKVFNMLINRTAGIRDYKSFVNVLSDINTLRVIPEASEIKSLLKFDKPVKSQNETLLITNFHKIFSNPKVSVQSALLQKSRNFSVIEEIKSNTENVKQSFISNFQLGNVSETAKKYIQKDELQGYFLDNKKIFPLPKTLREKVDFISLLGITLTGTEFLDGNRDSFVEMFNESVDYIYNSYLERINKGQILREPVKELREKYIPTTPNSQTIKGEFTSIDKLIEFETNYTKLAPSLSSRNSEGELQYLISLENQITLVTSQLNTAKTLKELQESSAFTNIKYNPLFSQSYIIQFLFDKDGNKIIDENGKSRSVSIGNLSGLKIQTSSKNTSKLERDLSPKEKFFQDFNMMLVSGRTDTVRTETSNTFYNIGIKNEKGKNVLFYQNNSFLSNFKDNTYFKRQMFKYLQGEKTRIQSYAAKKLENPNLPETYNKFFIFNNILENNSELKKSILENNITIDSPLFKTFMDKVDSAMTKEVQNFKNEMDNLGMEQDKLLSDNLKKLEVPFDALVRAFIANTFTQNIEFGILYSGDALFFQKKGPEYHKRLKGLVSTGDLASSIPVLNEYFNSPDEKAFEKKYSLSGMMGVTRKNNDKTFNTKTLKEYKQSSDFAYSQDSIIDEIHKSIIRRDGKEGNFSKEVIKNEILKDKNNQKPADGQGYVNLDFHRELSFRYGFLTPELEDAYKYEGLIYKKNFVNGGLTVDEKTEFLNLEKKIFENPDKYGIPVLKVTYYGPIANTSVDGKAYDKFSIAPLLPSDFTKEDKLKKLSDDMIKQQMGYVKYDSATKLFTTPSIDILEVESTKPDEYNTELLKLQIKPKIKQTTSTAIPTQLLKLIFSNLFDNGNSKDNVKALMNKYLSALKGIQKTQTEALLKDMGISDTIDYNILSEKLIKQARLQKLSSNVISALEDSKIGGFGSLEKSGFISQIIDLMAGYADSNLRRFELPGGDFVLVSNANRSKLKFYKYSDDGTMACECKITLTKEHTKLLRKLHPTDGQPIESLDRLNKLLLNKDWVKENEKSLTVLLDRVPTQGPNSMDFAIVKEFLSPTSGSIIILPEEIVYKSGTDFDFDKEKVLLPSLTYNGEYISEENLPILKEKIRKLEEEYGDLLNQAEQEDTDNAIDNVINAIFNDPFASDANLAVYDKLNEVEDLIRTYFQLQKPGNLDFAKNANSIIEAYKETLALPEMFAELVIPNSTRTLKPLSERNATLAKLRSSLPMNEQVYHYVSNLFVKNTFFDSKNMLGPFAKSNTFNQMMQYFKINIKNAYFRYGVKKYYGKDILPQKINNLLLKKDELAKITDSDKLLTSLRDDIDGYIKQHWDSEAINATVDAAKDPWFALMRINRKNIGVVGFMKVLGYPMERTLDFINQPILQEYFTLLNNGFSKNQALTEVGKKLGLKEVSPIQGDLIQSKVGLDALKNDPSIEIISVTDVNGGFSVQFRKLQPLTASKFKKTLLSIDNKNITPKTDSYNLLNILNFNDDVIDKLEGNIQNSMKLDSLNLRTLAHFIAMEEHSNSFSKFMYYFNFDTNKVSTPTDLMEKSNQRKELFNDEMFDAEDLIRMEESSMMSPFINNDTIKNMFDKTLPLLQNQDVQKTLASIYNAYKRVRITFNRRNLRLLPKALNNDFLTSVLFNYYTEDNTSFIKNNIHLLVRSEGKKTIADRLESFKNMPFYKDLSSKFPILENFIIEKHVIKHHGDYNEFKIGTVIDNIRMIKSNNESPLEIESNIDQLRTLYNYVIDNPSYKEEDLNIYNKALKIFVDDLFKVGLLQSGMGKTYIGFSEFIPYEFVKKYYDKAISNYESQPSSIKATFLDNFYAQFIYNNPKFFPNIKQGERYVKNNNNYSHKFKRYDINLDYKFDEIMSEESEELEIKEQNETLSFNNEQDAATYVDNNNISTNTIITINGEQFSVVNSENEDIQFVKINKDLGLLNQANINTLIDEKLIKDELTNGRYSFYLTEQDAEKDNGTLITKDNVDKAIETEKKLGDVIYNNKSNILTSIPSAQIEVEVADGVFEEFTSAKELEDFINDTKVSKNDRDKARVKYNELKSIVTGIPIEKNIYKGAVQEFIEMLGGKKTSKGLLQVDGQHYYLDMNRWIILNKSNSKELFLNIGKDDVYIGSAPLNSNNFISESFTEGEFNEWKNAITGMKFNDVTDNKGYTIKINNSDVKLLNYNELDLYSEDRVLQLDVMSKSGLEYKVFFDGDKFIVPETKEFKEILSLIIEDDNLTSDDFKCNI